MNLCIITENEYRGGLDTFIVNLVNAWPDDEARLTLICNDSHPGLETIYARAGRLDSVLTYSRVLGGRIARGVGLRSYLLSRLLRGLSTVLQWALQYPVLAPWYVAKFSRLFRRSDFTHLLVVNGGYPASLVCRCASVAWRRSGRGRTAVMAFHNFYQPPSVVDRVPQLLLDREVARSCSTVVSVSKACLDSLRENPAFHDVDLLVIENGLEDGRQAAELEGCTDEVRALPDRYCLVLATLELRKGHEFAMRAFRIVLKRHPDVHLCMFGHGTPKEERRVAALIDEFGLRGRAHLGGFTHCGAALMKNAEVLLVPSQAFESFGLTIIEAMSLSRPVVATDVGGIPEVLAGTGGGTVVSASDPVAFADAICQILDEEGLARRMGARGRASFETRFTAARMAAAYCEALSRSGAGP